MQQTIPENYMRPAEAAKMLGVSRATIYRWYNIEDLDGIKLGRAVWICRQSVNDLIVQAKGGE